MRDSTKTLHYLHKCARLGRGFLAGGTIHCNLQVTYRCNFSCQICDFWKDEYQSRQELTVDDIEVIARKLASLGTIIVSLAGGEPLLRSDLPRVIQTLAQAHFPILITNGWHVDAENSHALFSWGLQEISVSLDYAAAEKHDAMRGHPGAFARAVHALELLVKNRPSRRNRVHMITVLMDDNLEEIEPLVRLAREIGVTYMVNLYSPSRGSKAQRLPRREVSRYLLGLKRRYREFVSLSGYLERFDEAVARGGVGECRAGLLYLNIDHTGNVSRCTETTSEPVGNILREPMAQVREKLRRQNRENPCAQCWTSCRGFAETMYRPPRLRNCLEFLNTVRPH